MSHGVVPTEVARAARGGLAPVAKRLHAVGITASAITVLGVALTIVGAALLVVGQPGAALAVLAVGALADALDGAIARAAGGGTRFGAFLDSTADRLADAAIFSAAAALGASQGDPILFWSAMVALSASFLVSYVRAKAESLGAVATVGPAPREARLVIVLAGIAGWTILALPPLFVMAVAAVALLSTLTLIQRVVAVAAALQQTKSDR